MATFFNERVDIDIETIDEYGAFNVSIVNDLPLFIDPFLLFHSDKPAYRQLHDDIIRYLIFLRDKSSLGIATSGLLRSWYCFPEVKQNWLGFSVTGNGGSGLGIDFAQALHANLHKIISDFGGETITKGSHLEKVCLISDGVGRDNISDFTTNLIKNYLCEYTETFAKKHLQTKYYREVTISRNRFNFTTETWERGTYQLPWIDGDFVILTPRDILTRDENWINKHDLITNFKNIPTAVPDGQLRAEIQNYFHSLVARASSKKERDEAATRTILRFPILVDFYIKLKELSGERAVATSLEKVSTVEKQFVKQVIKFQRSLSTSTLFYNTPGNTYDEAHNRLLYLKDVIENKGGHRIFYDKDIAIGQEKDVQILFRLVWFGTPSDVTSEANDGRGPVDFKISRGAADKTLVEFKLAKNSSLERNLVRQVPIYQAASDAKRALKAIIFFSQAEQDRVLSILEKLKLVGHRDIVLIDARNDNKPSGSKA